jgi:hypothetical protein
MFSLEPPSIRDISYSDGKDAHTTNTMLAAALAAMGIEFDEHRPFSTATGDGICAGGRVTFYFKERSNCGQFETRQLIKAWEDRTWHEQNPDHPWAYIKCAFENHSRLVDKIKHDTPLGLVRRHKKLSIVSLGASQATQDLVYRRLRGRR